MSEKWWTGRIAIYMNKGMNREEARAQVLKDMRDRGKRGGTKKVKKGFAINDNAKRFGKKGLEKRYGKD